MVKIYDIETLASCFTYTDIDKDTNQITQFVLHKDKFELFDFINYLKTLDKQVGFNNINFDYPILHYILLRYDTWKWQLNKNLTYSDIIKHIHNEAQRIITEQNKENFTEIVAIKHKDWKIEQLDLFKIWHYNNKARSTSLKALEISMNYPNVMEMPISHKSENITLEEVNSILEYNLNDVLATFEFYKKSIDKIKLRQEIRDKYNIPCLNFNNGKIGEQLILKLYCDKTEKDFWEVRKQRTYRKEIKLIDCIPEIIEFKTDKFNSILDYFKNTVITETKGSIDKSIIYKQIEYVYGTGGIHACIKSGVYKSDDNYIIKTCDVASLYPNLPIAFNFWIEHLGQDFLEVYRDNIVNVRMAEKSKPKEQQDLSIVDGYKEAANVPYGKSNENNSFLYDPLYTMKTTIAGQLVLSMLAEKLSFIQDSQILMVNTDGIEIKIPRNQEHIYETICREWESITKLTLEHDEYSKMWIRDVNNYGALTVKGKIKNKGAFEVDKKIGNEPAYHKDNSFRIIPISLQQYFVHNIPIENTVKFHFENDYKDFKNYKIYDFCGRQKFTQDSYGEIHRIERDNSNNPFINIIKQQKNVRYYISNKGDTFIKQYKKGTSEVIHRNEVVTIFNNYIEQENYNIKYEFYIKECKKIIDIIESKQMSLSL